MATKKSSSKGEVLIGPRQVPKNVNIEGSKFSGRMFYRYPDEISDASIASELPKKLEQMSKSLISRAKDSQTAQKALQLQAFLNSVYKRVQEKDNTLIERMGTQLIQTMSDNAVQGLQDAGLGYSGGLSFRSQIGAQNQAKSIYDKTHQKYAGTKLDVKNPVVAGSSEKVGSSNYYLSQLLNGKVSADSILSIGQAAGAASNVNGEMLERFLSVIGDQCYQIGQEVGGEALDQVVSILEQSVASGDFGKRELIGKLHRSIYVNMDGEKNLRVIDSEQKVDALMNFNFGNGNEQIRISAKSIAKMDKIKALTSANLVGLLTNTGVMGNDLKFVYSALTVYSGSVTVNLEMLKKILVMQALMGTTDQTLDTVDYMVYQVGNKDEPFRVVSLSNTFNNESQLENLISQSQVIPSPKPLPIGANTYLDTPFRYNPILGRKAQARSEATMNAVLSAQVSVILNQKYVSSLYSSPLSL